MNYLVHTFRQAFPMDPADVLQKTLLQQSLKVTVTFSFTCLMSLYLVAAGQLTQMSFSLRLLFMI